MESIRDASLSQQQMIIPVNSINECLNSLK